MEQKHKENWKVIKENKKLKNKFLTNKILNKLKQFNLRIHENIPFKIFFSKCFYNCSLVANYKKYSKNSEK